MGYDVTFHPVDRDALQYYVFDVLDQPELTEARTRELAAESSDESLLAELYAGFPEWIRRAEQGEVGVDTTFAFACAAVAGFLHPFWFARGCAVSFLAQRAPQMKLLFQDIPSVGDGRIAGLSDANEGVIQKNNAGSGLIRHDHLGTLQDVLEELDEIEGEHGPSALFDVFGKNGLDALHRAMTYAADHGLDLMEATEVVVPARHRYYTRAANMRAHYLDKLDP